MPRSANLDPLTKFEYNLFILTRDTSLSTDSALAIGGFQTCNSPAINITTRTYHEGGGHMNPHHIVDRADFNELAVRRGVFVEKRRPEELAVDRFQRLTGSLPGSESPQSFADIMFALTNVHTRQDIPFIGDYRFNLIINHYRRDGSVAKRYIIYDALPIFFQPASDFDAMDDTSISFETIRFRYEGFEVIDVDEPSKN